MLLTNLGTARAQEIMNNLGLASMGAAPATPSGSATPSTASAGGMTPAAAAAATATFTSPLQFYDRSQMTMDEFALIGNESYDQYRHLR